MLWRRGPKSRLCSQRSFLWLIALASVYAAGMVGGPRAAAEAARRLLREHSLWGLLFGPPGFVKEACREAEEEVYASVFPEG